MLDDPAIHVAVELVGGVDWARRAVLDLLAAGKDVVTANKALLAEHGAEVFDAARRHGRAVAFEASVAGGIPIIAALAQSLAANQILSLQGILNGTCNFILTGMTEQGRTYAEALAEAQRRGYAEADPTLDVDGTDAAHKLAILAQIAFGVTVPVSAHRAPRHRRTCTPWTSASPASWATRSSCWPRPGCTSEQLALHVSPVLLRHHAPLAQVRGAYNAIHVVGDAVGDTLYYGQGAGADADGQRRRRRPDRPGGRPGAADVPDAAAVVGRRTTASACVRPPAVRSRFYLRLLVADRPGVLAEIGQRAGPATRSASRR